MISNDSNIVQMLRLTNVVRKRWKLKVLQLDFTLSQMAAERADNMASEGALYHTKGPAENVGFGFDSPDDAIKGWMNSPGHRDNITNRECRKIGVGVSSAGGVYWWCILFSR